MASTGASSSGETQPPPSTNREARRDAANHHVVSDGVILHATVYSGEIANPERFGGAGDVVRFLRTASC